MNTTNETAAESLRVVWAGASGAILVLAALLTLPVLDEPWGARPWFQAMYLCGVFLLEGLIALFLALHVLAGSPARAQVWLAGGYAFTAVTAAAQFLCFPGILDRPLATGAQGEQAAIWLWVSWHAGFPCFVLLAVAAKSQVEGRPRARLAAGRFGDLRPVAAGARLAVAAAALMIGYPQALPPLAEGNDFSRLSHSGAAAVLVMINVFALAAVAYATRLRELLYLWLALALLAFTLEVALSMAGAARYSAGWYVGRGLSLASAAALMVALMIEHFRLHRDAEIRAAFHEQEALHDPLTGLFNRRHLARQLTEELGRARRYRYPLSVLLLDLDHFKRINDRYGHGTGDECLRALAATLGERGHRSGDFSARFGGEEFVVVLPETGWAAAADVAEDLRRRVEGLPARGAAPCPMTASIGIATSDPATTLAVDDLLAAADAGLYRAKQGGRNRVAGPDKAPRGRDFRPTPA